MGKTGAFIIVGAGTLFDTRKPAETPIERAAKRVTRGVD
jgi:hypothetical protein